MDWSIVLVWTLLVVGFLAFGALILYRRGVETHVELNPMFYGGLAMVGAGVALSATVGLAGVLLIVAGGIVMFTVAIRSHRSVRR